MTTGFKLTRFGKEEEKLESSSTRNGSLSRIKIYRNPRLLLAIKYAKRCKIPKVKIKKIFCHARKKWQKVRVIASQ